MTPDTERIRFQKYSIDYLDEVAKWYQDAEMMRYYGGIKSRDEVETMIRERHLPAWEERGYGYCILILKETGEAFGHCGLLHQFIDDTEELEVGYLLRKDHWGRGLATEAASALYDYALNTLGNTRITSIIHPENKASIRIAEKNGLSYEKTATWRDNPASIYSKNT